MLDRLKTLCRGSLTIAWAYVLALVGAVLSMAPLLVDILPSLQPYVPPGYMGLYTVVIAVVTFVARLRSLGQ